MAGDDTNSPLNIFKKVYSTGLLIFSIIIIMGLIFNEQTKLSQDVHPGLAFVTCWIAIIWLTMVEGGQASLVGLVPIDEDLYKESHQTSLKSTSITNEGDNLDRYLLGRQLMVVVVVFTVNISAAPIADASLWGFSDTTINIFLGSGLSMILFVCMVGQLNSQVNASHCMLDYINNYFAVFTTWTCMAIEFSGVVHFSYVLQFIVAAIAGKPIESKEGEKTAPQKLFFWARCAFSFVLLGFSFAVTLVALFDGKTPSSSLPQEAVDEGAAAAPTAAAVDSQDPKRRALLRNGGKAKSLPETNGYEEDARDISSGNSGNTKEVHLPEARNSRDLRSKAGKDRSKAGKGHRGPPVQPSIGEEGCVLIGDNCIPGFNQCCQGLSCKWYTRCHYK